jgi:hypothetical protein
MHGPNIRTLIVEAGRAPIRGVQLCAILASGAPGSLVGKNAVYACEVRAILPDRTDLPHLKFGFAPRIALGGE